MKTMQWKRIYQLTLLAAGTTVSTFALADVLFEHPFPTPNSTTAWCTSCGGSYREWDAFDLAIDADITEIDARLYLEDPTLESNLEYSVWDASRTTQIFAESFAAAGLTITSLGAPSYDVFAPVTGLTLSAGTYYLSIYDPAPPNNGSVAWYQSNITLDGRSFQSAGASPLPLSGGGTGGDQAFRIIGVASSNALPEPATLGLLGAGVLGFVAMRRVRFSKPAPCSQRSAA